MRVSELTFGCDGASAAAPIANASTAFILGTRLARCASLTMPSQMASPYYWARSQFKLLGKFDPLERVHQPSEGVGRGFSVIARV